MSVWCYPGEQEVLRTLVDQSQSQSRHGQDGCQAHDPLSPPLTSPRSAFHSCQLNI